MGVNWRGKGAVLDIYVHGDDPDHPTWQRVTVDRTLCDYHGNVVCIELEPLFTGQPSAVVPWAAIRFISVVLPSTDEAWS